MEDRRLMAVDGGERYWIDSVPSVASRPAIFDLVAPDPTNFAPSRSIEDLALMARANEGLALSSSVLPDPGAVALTPDVAFSVEGIDFDTESSRSGFFHIPPDPHGAAGGNYLVSVVNSSIEWHTKAGVASSSQSLNTFFSSLSPVSGLFDPKVLFDHFSNRFIVVALERTDTATGAASNTSRILLAASDDSDPNGVWNYHAINGKLNIGGTDAWADYPGFALDEDAIYITNNMFSFGASGSFQGSRLWIVPKAQLYGGTTPAVTVHDPSTSASVGFQLFTIQPTTMYEAGSASTGTFLVSLNLAGPTSEFASVIRVDNPLTAPTFTNSFIDLGNIQEPNFATFPNSPQPGSSKAIWTNDMRAQNAVYRNNNLYFVNTIYSTTGPNANQETAHWYRVNTSNLASLTLADQGDISGEDISAAARTFFPSVAVDGSGNMVIGFAAAGPSLFGGAYYTMRAPTDAAGTVQESKVLAAGLDTYVRTFTTGSTGRNRWGDYSATVFDPAANEFWVFNEYARTQGTTLNGETGRWGTRWGKVLTTAGPTDDHGDDAVTATLVAIPSSTAGNLEVGGDNDFFKFVATAGVAYTFETILNTLNDSILELYDTNGTSLLLSDDDGGVGFASKIDGWLAPANGTYFLNVRDFGNDDPGTYSLSATLSDDHGNDFSSATAVAVPSVTAGNIEQASDVDYFSFSAVSGFQYAIETNLLTLGDSTLTVYDTNGTTQLSFDDNSGVGQASLLQFTAPASGTYFIKVDNASNQTGTYELSIESNSTLLTLAPMLPRGSNAYEANVTGSIAGAADFQSFVVADVADFGAAGQLIAFGITPSATLAPEVELYANGTNVATLGTFLPGRGLSSYEIVLSGSSGTIELRVRGNNGTIGSFDLFVSLGSQVEIESFEPPTNNSFATAQIIDPQSVRGGSIGMVHGVATLNSSDFYRIAGAENMGVALTDLNPVQATRISLYNSAQVQIAEGITANNLSQVINDIQGQVGSDYFIEVHGGQGAYNLVVTLDGVFDQEANSGSFQTQPSENGIRGFLGDVQGTVLERNFAGIDFNSSFCGCEPPDTHSAVGPNHVVEVINTAIAVYNKDGTVARAPQALTAFFNSSIVAGETFDFDPVVAYDELAQRWIVAELIAANGSAAESDLLYAVSDTSDPTGTWTEQHRIDFSGVSPGLFVDYPKIGYNADAHVFSFNMFNGNSYSNVDILTIDKSTVLDANPATFSRQITTRSNQNFTMAAATMHGAQPGDPMWFVEEAPFLNMIRVVRMDNVLSAAPIYTEFNLGVSAYTAPPPAAQPGGNQFNTNDTRILNAEWRGGRLVATHTVDDGSGDATVRWYEFSTLGASPTLTQEGNVRPGPGIDTYFPSIAINAAGDIGINYMRSSATENVSMYASSQPFGAPAGILSPPVLIKAGNAIYSGGRGGDYSGLSVDPIDDSFWGANEVILTGSFWSTWIGNFRAGGLPDEDWIRFSANAGDLLDIDSFPGGRFVGQAPAALFLDLFGPNGTLVASGAAIDHVAAASGTYALRVLGIGGSEGDYYVKVAGSTEVTDDFDVVHTVPAFNARLGSFPSTITLDLSATVRLDSLSPADVVIGGMPATSLQVIDGDTVQLGVNPAANAGDGTYTISIAAAAFINVANAPVHAFNSSFEVDTSGPRIVGTLWNGAPFPASAAFAPGTLDVTLSFNESLLTLVSARRGLRTPGTDDIRVVRLADNTVTAPIAVSYVPATNQFTANFPSLAPGAYQLRVISGNGAFEDLSGNDLDGDPLGANADRTPTGNGTNGGDYVLPFSIGNSVKVTTVIPDSSGFTALLNADLDVASLNLYDAGGGVLGVTDVTLVGASSGAVRGSLVVAPDHRQVSFIRTGGVLVPDTYTLTLRSAADGFKDTLGNLLDGNSDGTAGDDFVGTFVVNAGPTDEVTISIPDFSRGYGQSVNLPTEASAGIPVSLSTGVNVSGATFDLVFDPTLLSITSFSSSVAAASSAANLVSSGRMRVTISSAEQLTNTAGQLELGRFTASVPNGATYATKQILRFENVSIVDASPTIEELPANSDSGIHIAAFVGDANGSHSYSSADTTLLQRLVVGTGTGFSAYQLADPLLIADVNRSSNLTSGDVTLVQRAIVGTAVSAIPPLPAVVAFPGQGGPDPYLSIAKDLTAAAGDTISIPVDLEVTDPAGISVSSMDLAIAYDPSVLTLSNYRVGGMLGAAFGLSVNDAIPGLLRVSIVSALGPSFLFGDAGEVFEFDATVSSSAAGRSVALNLLRDFGNTITQIADNQLQVLTLIPAPTNADDDVNDGLVTVANASLGSAGLANWVPFAWPWSASPSSSRDDMLLRDIENRKTDLVFSEWESDGR